MKSITLLALAAVMAGQVQAQDSNTIAFSGQTWEVEGAPLSATYRSREALRLFQSSLTFPDADFANFVLEYDVAMEPGNGFNGVSFRIGGQNAEQVYFRHHLADQPDSFQYSPVLNGLAGWQIYASAGYWGQIDFPVGEWITVRLVVDGGRAQLSLDGQPVFDIPELIGVTQTGGIAIQGFGQTGSWITDISVRELPAGDQLPPMEAAEAPEIDGVLIDHWRVSPVFAESLLEGRVSLPAGLPPDRTDLPVEFNGIANLSRLAARTSDSNTVLAEAVFDAEGETVARLHFGYSDRIRVFLNGQLVYEGDNGWRTRDYRYLGTITRHYTVPLYLQAGENRLTMAVSEDFGGWGVTAVLEETSGVSIIP